MDAIYLDNSATTKPSQAVVDAMTEAMTQGYYNPSSLYAQALAAEKRMDACRRAICEELGEGQVLFVSGGTEANNLGILGGLAALHGGGRVLYSAVEHPSVREACQAAASMGFQPEALPVTGHGLVDLTKAEKLLNEDVRMLCVMQVNNETGALQPLEALAQLRSRLCPEAIFHVDAVQGFLRQPLDAQRLCARTVALSAHKIHGPKGVGALWLSKASRVVPRVYGGGQEGGIRPGTENTPGVAGLLAAIREYPRAHDMRALKLRLWRRLEERIPALRVNGPHPEAPEAADHILNLSFHPVKAQTMLHALEAEGVLVGNGAACSSKKTQVSRALVAMGIPTREAECAIRFSLNPFLTPQDMDAAADAVSRCYERLKNFVRR